jgi:hypothetical protein
MDPESLATDTIGRWKVVKAAGALESFWNRIAPEGAPFNQADAVAYGIGQRL